MGKKGNCGSPNSAAALTAARVPSLFFPRQQPRRRGGAGNMVSSFPNRRGTRQEPSGHECTDETEKETGNSTRTMIPCSVTERLLSWTPLIWLFPSLVNLLGLPHLTVVLLFRRGRHTPAVIMWNQVRVHAHFRLVHEGFKRFFPVWESWITSSGYFR